MLVRGFHVEVLAKRGAEAFAEVPCSSLTPLREN